MSFDEVQLPLRVGFGSGGGPGFSTEIITVEGGYERRNQNWAEARRRFDAATGLRNASDVSTLMGFFLARAGRARGFRLKDWGDFSSKADGVSTPSFSDQSLGTGNGTTTQFQLKKTYVSGAITHTRTIRKPVSGSVVIGVNGSQSLSGWSIDTTTGIITFSTAPVGGASLTAGYTFDVPVRFDTDSLNIAAEDFQLARVQIPLVEIRQ